MEEDSIILLLCGWRLSVMDKINYQKFLTKKICDLELNVEESFDFYFKRLKKELKIHRILFWPYFYFGNEW